MKRKNITKVIFIAGLALISLFLLGISLMVLFSPYGNFPGKSKKMLQESVLIKAPVEQVYQYLGNSDNAEEWSVYVNHISALNSNKIADGMKGSIRRCFTNQNEKGKQWDEMVIKVEKFKRRLLNCYNFKNFEMTAGVLYTEQLYKETKDGNCMLSFTLFLSDENSTFLNHLKMYFAAYEVTRIFKQNLSNIQKFNQKRMN